MVPPCDGMSGLWCSPDEVSCWRSNEISGLTCKHPPFCLSGRRDMNPRSLAPRASALPDFATPRICKAKIELFCKAIMLLAFFFYPSKTIHRHYYFLRKKSSMPRQILCASSDRYSLSDRSSSSPGLVIYPISMRSAGISAPDRTVNGYP